METMSRSTVVAVLLTFGAGVAAQTASEPSANPVITHPPSSIGNDADAELSPDITISERGETTVEEYRLNGQLYMIKIIPKKGVPYYLVDSNGDGLLSRRMNDLSPGFLIPSWVILRWR